MSDSNCFTYKYLLLQDDPGSAGRLSVVTGHWSSEEQQRQFGNDLLRRMPVPGAGSGGGVYLKEQQQQHHHHPSGGYISHVLVVDGDEFWHPAELHRALSLIATAARAAAAQFTPAPAQEQAEEEEKKEQERRRRLAVLAAAAATPFARGSMATYWKSSRTVVDPPER